MLLPASFSANCPSAPRHSAAQREARRPRYRRGPRRAKPSWLYSRCQRQDGRRLPLPRSSSGKPECFTFASPRALATRANVPGRFSTATESCFAVGMVIPQVRALWGCYKGNLRKQSCALALALPELPPAPAWKHCLRCVHALTCEAHQAA